MENTMKVLTIKIGEKHSTEIHMLNPREVFEGFGGSRHGLVVKKTASLITRVREGMLIDTERDITDRHVWEFIAKCINGEIPATAVVDSREEKKEA